MSMNGVRPGIIRGGDRRGRAAATASAQDCNAPEHTPAAGTERNKRPSKRASSDRMSSGSTHKIRLLYYCLPFAAGAARATIIGNDGFGNESG